MNESFVDIYDEIRGLLPDLVFHVVTYHDQKTAISDLSVTLSDKSCTMIQT